MPTRQITNQLKVARAIAARMLFALHNMIAIWRVWAWTGKDYYWLFTTVPVMLVLEGVVTIVQREGDEYKWFCPSIFIFLCGSVPAIWFLEMSTTVKVQQNVTLLLEMSRSEDIVRKGGGSTSVDVMVLSTWTPKMWMQFVEQTLLIILVLGRWILPKGEITRDELSQLLLAYLAISSDIVELFNVFRIEHVRTDIKLTTIVLTLWSVALIQFPLIITTTRGAKARYCWTSNAEAPAAKPEMSAPTVAAKYSLPASQWLSSTRSYGEYNALSSNWSDTSLMDGGSMSHSVHHSRNTSVKKTSPHDRHHIHKQTESEECEIEGGGNNELKARHRHRQHFELPEKDEHGFISLSEIAQKKHLPETVLVPAEETFCEAFKRRMTDASIWGIITTVALQDGPFLSLRLYVLIELEIFDYTLFFFLCKNMLIISVQLYRLAIVFSKRPMVSIPNPELLDTLDQQDLAGELSPITPGGPSTLLSMETLYSTYSESLHKMHTDDIAKKPNSIFSKIGGRRGSNFDDDDNNNNNNKNNKIKNNDRSSIDLESPPYDNVKSVAPKNKLAETNGMRKQPERQAHPKPPRNACMEPGTPKCLSKFKKRRHTACSIKSPIIEVSEQRDDTGDEVTHISVDITDNIQIDSNDDPSSLFEDLDYL